jgi:pimeloyl-ACP methyl ester carboxylesterase/Ca2+-binding EF-hand superfamily protein
MRIVNLLRALPFAAILSHLSIPEIKAQETTEGARGERKIGDVPVTTILERLGAKMENGIPGDQWDAYARRFNLIDQDGDGRHSRVEFIENGNYLNPQARQGIFQAADADHDDFVTRAEYILNRIITDEAKAIMQSMDTDADGAVQRAEFLKHADTKLSDPALTEKVFLALDTDANGEIVVPEYLRVWGLWARAGKRTPAQRLEAAGRNADLFDRVRHGFAENNGVKIHYVTIGKGTPLVMIHGFPDFWYTWREQMEPLSEAGYQVVAIDQRGYNQSDKPKGVDQYAMVLLVEDVAAVIRAVGSEKAIVCGHDWGGAVAWSFAMAKPAMIEKLVILNLPHPRGLARELAHNPEQQKNSAYARRFQEEGAHEELTAKGLAEWVKDPKARARYVEAFERSDFEAMLNYYKKNYPRAPYLEPSDPVVRVTCPVLMIHGLDDKALLASALNDTWKWLEKDLTLVTIPDAGHFVQQDAPDLVTRTMLLWLGKEE